MAVPPRLDGSSPALQAKHNRWKHQILIVDDDPEHRRDTCELLHEEGYRTLAAWNGREAFGLLLTASAVPSLIVLDLVMDTVDGPEFRRRQLSTPRFADVPILVVSGRPDGEKAARELEADGFLAKPFDP
ncbi:MAG: response regulator, partial [Planctomycetota bacterium]